MKKIQIPTGYLLFSEEGKPMETLSIGDYGKKQNVKADFLGYYTEINGVPNGDVLPLSEKWVMTLSTQHGCVQKCTFCDVPNIAFQGNVSVDDLRKQVRVARECFPNVKYTERLNIHFARMGEPILNENVFKFTENFLTQKKRFFQDALDLRVETVHPVLTTMLPSAVSSTRLRNQLLHWAEIKNSLFHGQAGLQLSINSTSDEQRHTMFGGSSKTLREIKDIVADLPSPISRKYCVNIAYASGNEVDGKKLLQWFNPDEWMVKITPIHNNKACRNNEIKTVDGYKEYSPYRDPEESCKAAGYDVLVFIPSQDEEDSLITCGNAILGGSELKL